MRSLLDDARAQHVPLHAKRDDDELLLSKGSTWRLDVDGVGDVTQLSHIAPLPLPDCATHADSV
jgi:hypothetical protein